MSKRILRAMIKTTWMVQAPGQTVSLSAGTKKHYGIGDVGIRGSFGLAFHRG